ncbi:MAG: phytanoyl-CoA dioxygenase family protein [Alphaproteobacteria bacterium]|nr:phytanoyl-CoA dioxygenase family protein [Alphaproteobacteria bacterium]MDB5720996.1 phytanoyl-CoA dioxygenase family protein [Alphaproteobacteria bacterium]
MGTGTLASAEREAFERDGVACLRGLLSEDWIESLREAVAKVMATPTEYSRDLAREGGKAGSFYQEINVSLRSDPIAQFVKQSPIAAAAAAVMGSRSIRFFSDQLLVKEPATNAETPWHQDFPYFPCDGDQIGSVWLGLDPVTRENGAMSFVKGSHRTGTLFAPQNFGSKAGYESDPFDGPPPDVDADPEAYPTICYEMEPGDVTIHHARTLHGAKGNESSDVRRRGFTIRLAGDDIVWRNRRYMPRGFEPLEDGAPLSGPRYPLLFSR